MPFRETANRHIARKDGLANAMGVRGWAIKQRCTCGCSSARIRVYCGVSSEGEDGACVAVLVEPCSHAFDQAVCADVEDA